MLKFEDKITLGIFADITANVIRNIAGFISYFLGIQAHHIWQFAASAYFTVEEVKSYGIYAMIIGMFSDYAIAAFIGVITVYLLSHVGFRNYILKGLFIGSLAWLFIFTIAVRIKISRIDPNSISGSISFLFNHLLLGVLIIIIIKKYGGKIFSFKSQE